MEGLGSIKKTDSERQALRHRGHLAAQLDPLRGKQSRGFGSEEELNLNPKPLNPKP